MGKKTKTGSLGKALLRDRFGSKRSKYGQGDGSMVRLWSTCACYHYLQCNY